jgi:NIMA (never in mitosis gene a)-related kinase
MGRHPFEAKNEGALIRKIIKGSFPPVKGPYSQALVQLVEQLLTFDARRRPDTFALLRMPLIMAQVKIGDSGVLGCDSCAPMDAQSTAQTL